MTIPAVHRVCTRPERLALATTVGGISRSLAVHNIGSDGKDALRVCRVSIGRVLAYLLHEAGNQADRDEVAAMTTRFRNNQYRLKQVFAEAAVYCMGD